MIIAVVLRFGHASLFVVEETVLRKAKSRAQGTELVKGGPRFKAQNVSRSVQISYCTNARLKSKSSSERRTQQNQRLHETRGIFPALP